MRLIANDAQIMRLDPPVPEGRNTCCMYVVVFTLSFSYMYVGAALPPQRVTVSYMYEASRLQVNHHHANRGNRPSITSDANLNMTRYSGPHATLTKMRYTKIKGRS